MNQAFSIWLTGLSGSGKSTLAIEIEGYLRAHGIQVQRIDGDVMRRAVKGMFGYSAGERIKVARIYTLMATLLNANGISVVAAAIAPFREIRDFNRVTIDNYIEIYLNCPLEVCIERDVKGLYARRMRGLEAHVIGIDDPYEIPEDADFEVDTAGRTVMECTAEIRSYLLRRLSICDVPIPATARYRAVTLQ